MRRISTTICLVSAVIILMACGTPPGPISTPTSTGNEPPTEIIGTLTTMSSLDMVDTHVEFLIDNSNSMENDNCGNLGTRRYEFVNFVLDIFRTIPSTRSGNFILGAGSFGNDYIGYKEEIPISYNLTFNEAVKPIGNLGTSQNISDGIFNAISRLKNEGATQEYLFIITDGKLVSSDSFEAIRNELKPATDNENLSIIVALTCPEAGNEWKNNVVNKNIDVFFSMEEATGKLLYDLSSFLPNHSVWTPTNYPDVIPIAGYYRALNIHYWNVASTVITLTEATSPPIQITPGYYLPNETLIPVEGCKSREYLINHDPGTHWLLFIQPTVQQDLSLFAVPANGEPIELVNNKDKLFQIEVLEGTYYDLKFWKDCFQMKFSFTDQLGNPVNGITDPAPLLYDNETHKLSATLIWHPLKFQEPQQIYMEIQIVDLLDGNVVVWKTATALPVQVKFEAKFDSRDKSLIPANGSLPAVEEHRFSFSYVSIQPKVFLITTLTQDSIVATQSVLNFGFPPLESFIGNQDAAGLQLSNPECFLTLFAPGEKHACISFDPNQSLDWQQYPLFQTYTFNAYDYVVSSYGFTRLFFHWDGKNIESKAISWECPLDFIGECWMVTPQPVIH